MTTAPEGRRLVLKSLARQLAEEAVTAARDVPADTAAWRFYHGVEEAARHALHPEIAGVRQGSGWLEAEDPSFRAGFLEGSTALATAAALPDPPLRVHLPQPSLGV